MSPLRVLIVDDVTQVRHDLRLVLSLADDVEIVGEAANGLEAICQADAVNPEVILLDLEMPLMDGYTATAQIKSRFPGCRIVALTVHDYPQARRKAFQAGVDAFIVKGDPVIQLIQTIFSRKDKP
jgi:DNA-binding NarL/FixJ family response regulator